MGKRAAGESTEFSRRVVSTIEELRLAAQLTNAELIEASGLSSNYYYIRLRNEAPFNVNDIEHISRALGTNPLDLMRLAAASVIESAQEVRISGREFGRRLRLLAEAVLSDDGSQFDPSSLVDHLRDRGIAFSAERWASLLEDAGTVRVSVKFVQGIASFFEVDPEYLLAGKSQEVVQRIDAELELVLALRATGAQTIAARSLGQMSPKAIRAVTQAILSIDPHDR